MGIWPLKNPVLNLKILKMNYYPEAMAGSCSSCPPPYRGLMRQIPVIMCEGPSMVGFPDSCYQQRFYYQQLDELTAQEVPTGLEYSTPDATPDTPVIGELRNAEKMI
ncbi:hypothetical protein scyTo_0000642 [Scyliorhinus torazame]|uniref:Uncharacterized protein n=1 Tax=Scyliorhinus torazame TaxID=75743 RepID=A0A401P128_SCYTO|nr:hypothetical protein [Scyliorhinus torazame]